MVKEGRVLVEERKALGRQELGLLPSTAVLSIAVFLAIGLALAGCSNGEEAKKDGGATTPSS
jgi:hypothetical protein